MTLADDAAQLPPLDRGRGLALLAAAQDVHVVVLGDVMLDHFMVGRVSRVSPEAPVPIVEFEREFRVPGGAANVAANARALGARVTLVGVVGDDEAAAGGARPARGARHFRLDAVTDPSRPTTRKTRLATTRNQQVARVDVEHVGDVDGRIETRSGRRARRRGRIGAGAGRLRLPQGRRHRAGDDAGRGHGPAAEACPLLVDPKVPHIGRYAGATLLTPNHHEAEAASGVRIRTAADARRAARALAEQARVDGVLITWGEHGLWLSYGAVEGHLPAAAREVADVTGAGDTVAATMGVALAAGATPAEAARLANEAAGVVVTRFGTAVVSAADLRARL